MLTAPILTRWWIWDLPAAPTPSPQRTPAALACTVCVCVCVCVSVPTLLVDSLAEACPCMIRAQLLQGLLVGG